MFWEPAAALALSIFLTISLFLLLYGMAYLIVIGTIKGIRNIKKIIEEGQDENR